jgi:hypothetical protein
MASHWCKVASNLDSHPKIRKSGRLGREVFLFALRRNAEPGNKIPGQISAAELDPDYLADILQMSRDEAVTGVTAAVTAGLLRHEGSFFCIVGFEAEWGKTAKDGKERTAKWRENKKLDNQVTVVTSPNVTVTRGDACDALDKTRSDYKRESREPAGLALLFDKVDQAGGETGKAHNTKAAKRRAADNPDHQAAIDAFHARFKAAYGTKPDWNGKNITLLSALIKRHPLPVLIERMEFMFAGRAKWPPPPYSADVFVQHFDRWIDIASSTPTMPLRKVEEL